LAERLAPMRVWHIKRIVADTAKEEPNVWWSRTDTEVVAP
jgi:hypothetical protein